jgi:hypothetical protein
LHRAPRPFEMKLTRLSPSAAGPLASSDARSACSSVATGHPGRAQRLGEAVVAARRLPCAARLRGPVAQLPPFAALTVVGQSRRVRARGALRARAPNPVLLGASHAHWSLPGCSVAEPQVVCETSNTDAAAGKAAGGAWAGRIGAAEERRASGRARSAHRELTRCRCLSAESAANEASSATGPDDRAPEGTRSEAKGQPPEPGPGRARRLARTDACVSVRTQAISRNGPKADRQGLRAFHPPWLARSAMIHTEPRSDHGQ